MSVLDELNKQKEQLYSGFKKASPVSSEGGLIKGVMVPLEIEYDGGKLRFYVELDPSALESERVFTSVLDHLSSNFEVAVWRKPAQSGFKKNYSGGRY